MKKTLDVHDFINEFKEYGRDTQFSREGLSAIFDYLEECNPDWEIDVIAVCCDFTEYDEESLLYDYDYLLDREDYEDDEEYLEALLEELESRTLVLRLAHNNYVLGVF